MKVRKNVSTSTATKFYFLPAGNLFRYFFKMLFSREIVSSFTDFAAMEEREVWFNIGRGTDRVLLADGVDSLDDFVF